LEYRDYNIETASPSAFNNKKQRAVYQLLKHMIISKTPIDAIGIQGHYDIGNFSKYVTTGDLKFSIERFKGLGLEVYMTEVDFGTGKNSDGTVKPFTAALAEQQKTDYYNCIKIAATAGVQRIYTWGIVDNFDKGWRFDEYPLPWDKDAKKKSAYEGIKQGLIESR
jgi:endo-1,4-beta-xylanase